MEPAQDGEPRFLHHLLCHRNVPHEHPRQAEHARLIPIDQGDERQLVACTERLNEVCFISGVRRATLNCRVHVHRCLLHATDHCALRC